MQIEYFIFNLHTYFLKEQKFFTLHAMLVQGKRTVAVSVVHG